MSLVSKCCNAEILKHCGRFHPDNSGFFISTSWPACSKCDAEYPEEIDSCDVCGEGSDHLIETILGSTCKTCCIEYADELVVRES